MQPDQLTQVRNALVATFGSFWQAALAYNNGEFSGGRLLRELQAPDQQLKDWVLQHTNIQL